MTTQLDRPVRGGAVPQQDPAPQPAPARQPGATPSLARVLRTVPGARRGRWVDSYVRRLALTDVAVVVVAVLAADLARFGTETWDTSATWGRATTSGGIVLLWVGWLALARTRSPRVVGGGAEEYRRVVTATLHVFGAVAILSLVLRAELARGYLAIAFPLGTVGLVVARRVWRGWLTRRRRAGSHGAAVLVVGSTESAADMTSCFERDLGAGYRVVGVCVPGHHGPVGEVLTTEERAVPVLGDEHAVRRALGVCGADTVAVSAADRLGHRGMRALAWELAELDVDLVVSPGVADVAGPRMTVRPVAGLPLLHLEEPRYEAAGRVTKTAFDVLAALAALVVLSPVLLLAALAVKLTSRGPVLYRSERVGLDGRSFAMLKLRSMVDGADSRVAELAAGSDGNGVLFKLRADPRVTRVGKLLRRTSIDELPQLINVLRGEMSLVGPRPPLRSEVDTYTSDVHRRLLVKPGLTGLWQVSGRSDLSWEETVRLDLSYVENWSMVADLLIISRTVRAVLAGRGAY